MRLQKFTKIVSLLVSLAISASALSAEASSFRRAPSSVTEASEDEEALATEVDRQADRIFEELKVQDPKFPITSFKRAERAAVYKLKQMHVLTDMLKAAGPAPATALVATEVLTNFIIAPLLAARGQTAAAGVALTVPWGLMAALGVASYDVLKLRIGIARDLRIPSLRELDRIKAIVIGYDIKHRVSSAMYRSAVAGFEAEMEFDIVKKAVPADSTRIPFMTVAELETLIRAEPAGVLYLDHIYLERVDPELYVALMLRYLDQSPQLADRLLQILQAREPISRVSNLALRQHLIGVDELRKQIARDLKAIQADSKMTKKLMKNDVVDAQEGRAERKRLDEETKRLQTSRDLIARHEYALLHAIHESYRMGDAAEVERMAHEFELSLAALRSASVYVRHVPNIPARASEIRTCSAIFAAAAI